MANEQNLTPWPKGVSGNPSGGKKGKNLTTILKLLLDAEIEIDDPVVAGAKIKRPAKELINIQLIARAIKGDRKAIKDITDRLEGTPKQTLETVGDQPVQKIEVEILTSKNDNAEDKRNKSLEGEPSSAEPMGC